jgi:hypothetical protein
MKNKKGFMIPFFAILMTVLVAIVGAVAFLITTNIRDVDKKIGNKKAFYISEAGIYKAVWYLTTPPAQGGKGIDWRTTGKTESFGGGQYRIIVANYSFEGHPSGIKITSRGTYGEIEQESAVLAYQESAGGGSGYSLSTGSNFEMRTNSEISGDLFADGNVYVPAGARVINGSVFVTGGHTVTGSGQYVQGTLVTVPEVDPDTSYYDNRIATAMAGGPGVLQGWQTFNYLNLNGQTVYVNSGFSINGTIIGPGEIVGTGTVLIEKSATIGENVKIITMNDVVVKADTSNSPDLGKNVLFFGKTNLNFESGFAATEPILILATQNLNVSSNTQIKGLLYGGDHINIGSNAHVEGIVIFGTWGDTRRLESSSSMTFQGFDILVPPGFEDIITGGSGPSGGEFVIHKWL